MRYSNLGVLLRATGQAGRGGSGVSDARSALDPEHIDAYTNLGILLNGLKRTRGSGGRASAR